MPIGCWLGCAVCKAANVALTSEKEAIGDRFEHAKAEIKGQQLQW